MRRPRAHGREETLMAFKARRRLVLASTVLVGLAAACGGGDDETLDPSSYTPGVYPESSNFEAQCAAPRSGASPITGDTYPDRPGSTVAENNWLRSWTDELYLWYDEVPDIDPNDYATEEYFELLQTTAFTPSGNEKDRFHFTFPTDQWEALSEAGLTIGYGVLWAVLVENPPREIVVAYTDPNTPASSAQLTRGERVLTVDGVSVNSNTISGVNALNAGLFPETPGEVHTFTLQNPSTGATRTVTLQSDDITTVPVQNVKTLNIGSSTVGYLQFNDHIATAESQLIAAITFLRDQGADDLVLDVRYNGGGFLEIASQLAYMIAGPTRTNGRTFERLQFNDKYPNINPVTGQSLSPLPFRNTTAGFSVSQGQPLPFLDLNRVFVITGLGTCSASESIMNSLRGINVEVIQIGSTTCGKPFGFYPQDNCGTTYFSIQFRGLNDKGFGEYADGFSPANTGGPAGEVVPGCSVADDFSRQLGDPLEARFAAALGYLETGSCPSPATGVSGAQTAAATIHREPVVRKSPWLENRIMRR
jgi:carboxyl-terminal processing protease